MLSGALIICARTRATTSAFSSCDVIRSMVREKKACSVTGVVVQRLADRGRPLQALLHLPALRG